MNLLIVEDDARLADLLRRGLMAEGWTVIHAPDGEGALEALNTGSFNVVLLDLMLPGMSGNEVCRRVRAQGDWTPILMLTAMAGTEACVSSLRMGADDCLKMPFDFEELLARIMALARRHATQTASLLPREGGFPSEARRLQVSADACDLPRSVKVRA